MVLTTFFKEPKFYGDTSNEIIDTANAVMGHDPKFVANLAIYAREVMHLRSVSQVLIVELANHPKGKEFVRKAINKVVERVDDMTEIMAYQISNYKKPIPNSLKKGIRDAFPRFDEFALAKYDRAKSVTLKDLLCLTRPTPLNQNQSSMWKRLIEGNLEIPKTWETVISKADNRTKREKWEEMIDTWISIHG
jgi:60 kDa SS-A/Ro ribonucleoprotein